MGGFLLVPFKPNLQVFDWSVCASGLGVGPTGLVRQRSGVVPALGVALRA